jgi:hypothetical protein
MLGNSCIYSVLPFGPVTEETECPLHTNMPPRTSLQTAGNLLAFHHSNQKFIITISTSVNHKNLWGGGDLSC